MAKYGSGPSKSDVANNVAGWDLVGFDSGKSGGSSSGSTSSGSSRGSSGSSGGSDNDGGGRNYYTDTAGWGGGSKSGPNMARDPSRAGQTIQQGMYQISYDDLGYAKSARKTSDSAGYVVDGVTYDGNDKVVSGSRNGGSFGGTAGADQSTDYQALINAAVGKGDYASAAIYEQLRNEKIRSPGYTGKQTTTNLYSDYLPSSVAEKQRNYGTWEDFLQASGYQDYDEQVRSAIQAAVDAAMQGYQQQIETTDRDSAELARQAYVAKMLGQKNLDQQLAASGYAGGMADSQRIQTETAYQNNLNAIERQRLATVQELQSAITQAQASGNQQLAESLSGYLQNLQSQWASYVQQQESMANSDYWNQKQMDNSNYWNRQAQDTQARETARTNAMQLLSAGIMPDGMLLELAGLSQSEAAAIRSVYLNGQAGGTSGGTVSGGISGYDNGGLTPAQVQELQRHYGVTADGKWGKNSSAAAGGLSADEAWSRYGGGNGGFGSVLNRVAIMASEEQPTAVTKYLGTVWPALDSGERRQVQDLLRSRYGIEYRT